ncbi:kinase-like protein [Wolfiporia cocos MD-104 SS10]|uniref:non-specific serine/threonine protein kinase n=1 Tax=Wolfiporia cocos (strain MD-104) TaxID=742152 RepID=A0A2H3J7X3_WOLCO|nr:kinase-like protein [Wolfiporia cocos MD-104 SS10]
MFSFSARSLGTLTGRRITQWQRRFLSTDILDAEEPLRRYRHGGYHPVHIGDTLEQRRYTIVRKLGWGAYSTVWLARDAVLNRHVALKILTDEASSGPARLPEVALLQRIKQPGLEHPGSYHLAHMLHNFRFVGPNGRHVCLTFDILGDSVASLQQRCTNEMIPTSLLQTVSREVLLALDCLHRNCGIIHTDIKPHNILLHLYDPESAIHHALTNDPARCHELNSRSPRLPRYLVESQPIPSDYDPRSFETPFRVKLADLGTGRWVGEPPDGDEVQAPPVRAPEVITGAPYGTGIDIWGLACVLYYLWSGQWLFSPSAFEHLGMTRDDDHLYQIMTTLGEFPQHLMSALSFAQRGQPGPLGMGAPPYAVTTLAATVRSVAPAGTSALERADFADFLGMMLRIDPSARASANALLKHRWLATRYPRDALTVVPDVRTAVYF